MEESTEAKLGFTYGKGDKLGGAGALFTVNNRTYPKALSMTTNEHGTVKLRYHLKKQYSTFKFSVAIPDNYKGHKIEAPVRFSVNRDDIEDWHEVLQEGRRQSPEYSVTVSGVEYLDLIVAGQGRVAHGAGVTSFSLRRVVRSAGEIVSTLHQSLLSRSCGPLHSRWLRAGVRVLGAARRV